MLFTLEALNAEEGDCLLVHHGTARHPRHILVDGGPRATWANALWRRLRQMRELSRLPHEESLPIELVVLTHVDSDHVQGLLAMAEELGRFAAKKQPLPWRIEHLWHNSFDALTGGVRVAAIAAALPDTEASRVFAASVREGDELRELAETLGIPQNGPPHVFDQFVMRPDRGAATVALDDISLTVLSPTAHEVEALGEEWRKKLAPKTEKTAKAHGTIASAVAADTSVTNLSSIALLVEDGRRSMLLCGDARADQIVAGLRAAKRLAGGKRCDVDVWKLGHHGARGNASPELFESVWAKHYVISANGKHHNPDISTLDLLWAARGEGNWAIHTTFPRDAHRALEAGDKRYPVLKEIQAWFDRHKKVKVHYRRKNDLGIKIDLGDETLA